MNEPYDLAVIGGGSAGLTAAAFAAQLGVRVAVLDKKRIGGDCTWTGCVPTKTLIKTAKVAHQMRIADHYGLEPVDPSLELKTVMVHIRGVINDVYQHESPEALQAEGINVFLGDVRFLDPHTLVVDSNTIKARHILIATGAHPFVPLISGLANVDYLTYENLWDLEDLPRHLIVAGAGPIGCEIAQAFRRLGTRVTIVEGGPRMLPNDEPEAARILHEVFTEEGIDLRFDAPADRVWQDEEGIHVTAGGHELRGDALLIAVGRRPNVSGLDLERADVAYDARGIKVNGQLRTSRKHIYAAGDCIGSYQFTHYAGWQGFHAARNALLPGASRSTAKHVPWATFTDPEVAHVGLTEDEAIQKFGKTVLTCEWAMDRVDRARVEVDKDGIIKLVHQKDGTLLGATIVAARAGEMIHEWIVAMECRLKIGELADMIHIYPTYSTASMQVSADIRIAQLLRGRSGRVIRRLAHLMR